MTPKTVQWLLKGCMTAFVFLVIWSYRTTMISVDSAAGLRFAPASRPEPLYPGWPAAAEFSLIVLGMLLFSERTWKHHCVTLVLPFAVILYYLAVERPKRHLRWFLIGILSAVTLLMASTSTNGVSMGWDRFAKLAQVYGAYVWAYLLLILALVVILRRRSVQSSDRVIALRLPFSDSIQRSTFPCSESETINPAENRADFIPLSAQRNPPA